MRRSRPMRRQSFPTSNNKKFKIIVQQPADNEEGGFTLQAPDLRKLTAAFGSDSFKRGDRRSLLHRFLQQTVALINGAGIVYFSRQQEELTAEDSLLSRQVLAMDPAPQQEMAACSLDALRQEQTCYPRAGIPSLTIEASY